MSDERIIDRRGVSHAVISGLQAERGDVGGLVLMDGDQQVRALAKTKEWIRRPLCAE
jgi:hypothetical protein